MPSNPEIKEYYDNFLEKLKKDHERPNLRHAYVKGSLKNIIKPEMKVLDIGCGTGITTAFMGSLGATVTGVDISEKLIEFARENSAHPNVNYIVEDVTKLRLSAHSFDAIIIVDSLEHIPRANIPLFLETVTYHSKPTTMVYLNIPDGRYQGYIKSKYPDKLQIVDEDYDPYSILLMFKSFGLSVCQFSIYGLDAPAQYNEYFFVKHETLETSYMVALG